jgi:hypothetical protein
MVPETRHDSNIEAREPGRAALCAKALADAVKALGIEIRAACQPGDANTIDDSCEHKLIGVPQRWHLWRMVS